MSRSVNQRAVGWYYRRALEFLVIGALVGLLSACGGGGSSTTVGNDPAPETGTDVGAGPGESPGNDNTNSGGDNNPGVDENPAPGSDNDANRPPPASGETFISGLWVLEEIADTTFDDDWGVIQVGITPQVPISQLFAGGRPRLYPDGRITFRRACGVGVFEIMLGEPNGTARRIVPCNSEVQVFDDVAADRTDFIESALSPDGRWIAVHTQVPAQELFRVVNWVVVFDTATAQPIRGWQGYTPAWLPDGRIIFGDNAGILTADPEQDQAQRLLELGGLAREPAVSPDGTQIAFSFNQAIWVANVDGSNARRAIVGSARLRHPAWSPDGRPIIAYLATSGDSAFQWEKGVFAQNIVNGETWAVDLSKLGLFHTVRGPLSWNR